MYKESNNLSPKRSTTKKAEDMGESKLHIAMYPWLAMGHITAYLQLSNQLAERGHKISFFVPKKIQLQLNSINLHPNLITFHTITIPHMDGLPPGAETALDITLNLSGLLADAFDLTCNQVQALLRSLKPDFVFYDMAYWLPEIATELGVQSVCYITMSICYIAQIIASSPLFSRDTPPTGKELTGRLPGYPSSTVVWRSHETAAASSAIYEFGKGITLFARIEASTKNCDAISIRTCHEVEGQFCDYISNHYNKPVLLTGSCFPEPVPESTNATACLDERWANWLDGFQAGTVIYCCLGTLWVLEKDQFQELVLALEMTGLPFFAALQTPVGATSVEDALPEGFKERVGERGVVYGGWVQQKLILDHPSVGCYVTHCGFGSMWESLLSDNIQIVNLPFYGEHVLISRLLSEELKVAIEVEREENGWFSKESLTKTILTAMDNSEGGVGELIKKNHVRLKETLARPGFMSGYLDHFVNKLHELLKLK